MKKIIIFASIAIALNTLYAQDTKTILLNPPDLKRGSSVMKSGVYLNNYSKHCLNFITGGDHRALVAGRQENFAVAPLFCVLVSDFLRLSSGNDSSKMVIAAYDAGIVSQNISIFCASVGLDTRVRATTDQEKLREILQLNDSQHLMLNNPVGYKKD